MGKALALARGGVLLAVVALVNLALGLAQRQRQRHGGVPVLAPGLAG